MGTNSSQPLPSQQSEDGTTPLAGMSRTKDEQASASNDIFANLNVPGGAARKRKRKGSDAPRDNDEARIKSRNHEQKQAAFAGDGFAITESTNNTINAFAHPLSESGVTVKVGKKKRKHQPTREHADSFLEMMLDPLPDAAAISPENVAHEAADGRGKHDATVDKHTAHTSGPQFTPLNLGSSQTMATEKALSRPPATPKIATSVLVGQLSGKKSGDKKGSKGRQEAQTHQKAVAHAGLQRNMSQSKLHNGTIQTPAKGQGERPRKTRQSPPLDIAPPRIIENGPKSGLWSEEEKRLVDEVFQEVCAAQNIDPSQLAENVAAWEDVSAFLDCVREALPMRTRDSIRKFCQRHYRRGTRGPWSLEEDTLLRDEIAQRGKKWAEIARIIDRTPDDCRDRYEKILQYGSDREQGNWSRQDTMRLYRAVEECLAEIEGQRQGDVFDFINWEVVATKMGRKRSAKRCREKWQKLRYQGFSDQMSIAEWTQDSSRIFWQRGPVEKQFASFKEGDVYDALMEIYSAFKDPTETFISEQSFWTRVATSIKASRFDKRLRRYTFLRSLEECKSNKVAKAPSKALQAKYMADLILNETQKTSEQLERGYDESCPNHPAAKSRRAKEETLRKAHGAHKRALKPRRSDEFVYDSDDSNRHISQEDSGLSSARTPPDEIAAEQPPTHKDSSAIDVHNISPTPRSSKAVTDESAGSTSNIVPDIIPAEDSSQANMANGSRKKARKQKSGLAPADHDLPAFLASSQLSAHGKRTLEHERHNDTAEEREPDDEEARRVAKLEKRKRKEARRQRRLDE